MGHKKRVWVDPVPLALPAGGMDSHAHLSDTAFDSDRAEVLARARACGLTHLMNIFLDPLRFAQESALFADAPWVYFALGIHPCDGLKATPEAFSAMEAAFRTTPRLLAVGEIGLDYYWKDCPREVQMELFVRQLTLARSLGKPVIVHCREAEEDCLLLLESHGFAEHPVLWHCFGGDVALAKRLVHNHFYVSVPGPVTYPANQKIREALAVIPVDHLLLETDCPYLSPALWRGSRNEPAYTVGTARTVAEALGVSPEELWLTCGDNSRRFFGIPA